MKHESASAFNLMIDCKNICSNKSNKDVDTVITNAEYLFTIKHLLGIQNISTYIDNAVKDEIINER